MSGGKADTFREVLPKKGLLFTESQSQVVLCKPKLLPLKSFTLQRLEEMQTAAKAKAQQNEEDEINKEEDEQTDIGATANFESVSFE